MSGAFPKMADDERAARYRRFQEFEAWERKQARRADRPAERSIVEYWDEYVATLKPGTALAKNRPGLRKFLLLKFPREGQQVTLGELKPSQLDEKTYGAWTRAIYATKTNRNAPPTPGRVENIRCALQACFTYHLEELGKNPLKGLDKQPGWNKRRVGYLVPDKMERFCAAMPAMSADILRVEFFTLQRESTIRCLKKHEVDWHARDLLLVVKGGHQERVVCPLEAFEIIQRWAAISPSEYVFPNPRGGTGPVPYPTFRKQCVRAEKATGIRLQGGEPVRPHAARHGGARHLLPTTPLPLIQAQLTHKDLKTTSIYLGVSQELHEVLRGAMDAAMKSKGPEK